MTIAAGNNYSITNSTDATVIGPNPYVSGEDITAGGITFTLNGVPALGDTFVLEPAKQQSVFATLQNLITSMQSESDPDRYAFATDTALSNLDNALDRSSQIRAEIGSRMNVMDQQYELNSDFILAGQQVLSKNEDIDFASVISEITAMSTALQATQQTYVKLRDLTLFNYLR
jgi:flagellar hook-associated protein 3 FlgL